MLIDRYVVIETWRRLGIALAIVLISLVIERILRLFDVVSVHGGPMGMVWEMAMFLIPHYLGLALPAGFFLSIFLVVARLGDDNEFDVLLGCGMSPARFAAPFIASALVLVGISIALYGYAQPYSRYAYRAVYYLAVNVPWGAKIPEYAFSTIGKRTIVTADRSNLDAGTLEGVFVHQVRDGREIITTAARGELDFDATRSRFGLRLHDGVQSIVGQDGRMSFTRFDNLDLDRSFASTLPLFRSRGDDARELSLGELSEAADDPGSPLPRTEVLSELHARLVRAVSLALLPFLAIPMALAAKRGRRSAGIVFGCASLVLYHYVLQSLEGLADAGRVPATSLWGGMGVFAVLCLSLFWRAQRQPGRNPLEGLFALFEDAADLVRTRWRRLSGAAP